MIDTASLDGSEMTDATELEQSHCGSLDLESFVYEEKFADNSLGKRRFQTRKKKLFKQAFKIKLRERPSPVMNG